MTSPAPVAFPVGSPTLSGNALTVDLALQQPTRVTRRIADITLERFIVTRIFAQGGQVSGGAVVYDQATLNELYLTRDVEYRMPGQEYPVVTSQRRQPGVALVEDWGGKFDVTKEAKRRNDITYFDNQVTQLGNTIVRKINQRAISVLETAISGLGGATTFQGNNWNNYQPQGSSATLPSASPASDFGKAQLGADVDELGVEYDLWLVNPAQKYALTTAYGGNLAQMLNDHGIREVYASNRVTAGTAYAVASNQVGEIRLEEPLTTETDYDMHHRKDWVQSYVKPVMYVTNPYSIRKIVGLAG